MQSFSVTYKKAFKEFMYPLGYKIWKGWFYRETENICFFIRLRKNRDNHYIGMEIQIMPYCADMKTIEYEADEGYNGLIFYQRLMTDLFVYDPETKRMTQEKEKEYRYFYMSRFNASDDEATLRSLHNIRGDIENMILPYIHKFSDFEYCYNELFMLFRILDYGNTEVIGEHHLKNDFIYGLSLKLHEYENALVYVESKIERHKELAAWAIDTLAKVREGRFVDTIGKGWSLEDRQKLAKSMLRKDPNHIEWLIGIKEKMIAESTDTIKRFETIKEALLSKDAVYIDKLVAETEASSREYLRQMLHGK